MTQIFYRSGEFTRADIDETNRTVIVAFSSEQTVQRSFGLEVLSHNPIDVDLSFLNSGRAPLLFEHDREEQIGVVESATIDQDKVGRAVVRFSKSEDGDAVFQDVLDGIRSNISVGYKITGQRTEDTPDGKVVYCQWTPVEISVVSIPADQTVGIGRSNELIESQELNTSEPGSHSSDAARGSQSEQNTSDSQVADEVTKDDTGVDNSNNAQRGEPNNNKNKGIKMTIETQFDADEIRSAERARVSEITSLAKRFDADEVATQFIADGRSIDEFRAYIVEKVGKAPAVRSTASIGLSEKETQEYSLGRAIEALLSGDFSNAGYELECSRAAAKAQGKLQTRSNIFVPAEVLTRAAGANAVTATGNPSLVNRTKVGFMDVLFNNTIAQRLGVQYMSGNLNGVIELPKFTSSAQARFVDEGQDGTIDAISSGHVELKPRTLTAFAELTRSMVLNGTAMEQRIQAHLQKAIATKIDATVFETILADTGIAWGTLGAGGLDYAAIRALIKDVEVANALTDAAKFAFNPLVGNVLSTTVKDTNTAGIYLRADDGSVAGYQSASSNNVGSNIIFGDFNEVTVANWTTLELAIDDSAKFLSGGFLLRAMTDIDVAVTRPEAFAGYKNVL